MANIFAELDNLFGCDLIPADESGCLCSALQLMRELNVSLIMLTDDEGRIIAAEKSGFLGDAETIRRVATTIAQHLSTQRYCTLECDVGSHPQTGFGIRLTHETNNGILSGLSLDTERTVQQLESQYQNFATYGSVVWLGIQSFRDYNEQTQRVKQLLAEQDTLKQAHTYAVTTIIEEREERIREQRDYVIHLEMEVQKRSDALRKAMGKASQANEAKSSFLANMSHEIRTPMTAILGYADVLLENYKVENASPLCMEAIQTIRRNGKYLLELINDILDIAKVEAGKLVIRRNQCSPSELIAEVIDLMRMRAEEKGLSIGVEFDGPIPAYIQTDAIRVRQILVNLVGNAIKFTDEGGINIIARCQRSADPSNTMIEFDIKDSGIGMSGPQMAKLFKPFSQVDESAARRYGGTGLGLALSRRLAQALGGDISVMSLLGEGSTFRATITTGSLVDVHFIDHPDPQISSKELVASDGIKSVQLKGAILLAEDNPDNQRLIEFVLTKTGAKVVIANNGQEALDLASSEVFDLILMDMQMPVMDGYTATRELRKRGYKKPIIALTAHSMAGDRQKCLDAGCDEFATKPIDRNTLLPLLVNAMAKYAELQQ